MTVPFRRTKGTIPRRFGPGRAETNLPKPPRRGNLGIGGPACAKVVDTIYISAGFGRRRPDSGLANIPLPPGSGRIVSMRVAEGVAITAFSGPDRPDQWRRVLRRLVCPARLEGGGGVAADGIELADAL